MDVRLLSGIETRSGTAGLHEALHLMHAF